MPTTFDFIEDAPSQAPTRFDFQPDELQTAQPARPGPNPYIFGGKLDVAPGSFQAAFEPFPGVRTAATIAHALSPASLATQGTQLEPIVKAINEKAVEAESSLLSPGGVVLGAAAPFMPDVVGTIAAWTAAPSVAQGVETTLEGIEQKDLSKIAGGITQTGIGGATVLGGLAGVAKGVPRVRLPRAEAALVGKPPIQAPERLLTGAGRQMPEFSESTLEPGGPPKLALPAPGETAGSVLLPESPLGPRTAGYRIELPVESETAKMARQRWSKPIDIEAQVIGADALRQLVSMTEEQKTPGQPYKPPTVNVDLRQLERQMQRNTVNTVEGWADQVIQDRLKNASSNPFLDPEFMAAAMAKGAILFKKGVTQLGAWSDEMRKQFGRGFDDQLPIIFQKSKDYWESKAPNSTPTPKPPPTTPEAKAPISREAAQRAREDAAIEKAKVDAQKSPDQYKQEHLESDPNSLAMEYQRAINTAIAERSPIYAAWLDQLPIEGEGLTYGGALRAKGWVREGKLYVYKPDQPAIGGRLPKVKKGYVRLWRGEREGQKGVWFSDSRETAEMHFENNRTGGPTTLSYIDVPEEQAFEYGEAAFTHPDVKSGKTIAEGGDHVLPHELASKAQVVKRGKHEPLPTLPTKVEASTKPSAFPAIETGVDPSFHPSALTTEASKTVGITPPGVAPLDLGQKISSTIRKWFTVAGHLPEEVHEQAVKMGNLQAASDFRIKMMERDLMDALKETYGLSSVQVAGGGSRRIPAAAVQLMDDYLHNRVANATRIPAPVRSVLDTMRSEMDAQSNGIITELTRQANQLPGSSPRAVALHNLINKIKDNMGIYVHRAYKFFDSSEGAADWYKNLNAGIKIKAEDYIMQNGPPLMTRAEAQSRILDWLSDLKGDSTFTGGSTLGAKDLSIFMKRGVIAPELRAVLGEYHNPLVNYAKSMSKMADWVAKQRFLNEVRRLGMGRYFFEEGANPPGFNTQIAGEGSNVMSPLNGLRTSEEIAAAFHDLGASPNPGMLAKTYLTLNAFSKFAATGLSMLTQVRNLTSRPFMALMAGHTQLGKVGRSVKAIAQDFAGNDATWKAYLNRLYELGVLGDTARAGELQAIIKDAALRDVEPNALFHWSLGRAIKKYGYRIPAEIYRLSDELGNVFGFENEKAIQARVHPNWTPAQIETEAAKITRELYPVYSETPRGVKAFRRVAIVGPFVTFPYQMYRTVFNGMARTIHELRSANPVERRVGAKRLAGQMTAIAGTAAIAETGKAILGINQQQEEDFRRFQPPWSKNSKWLFTAKDDKGKLSGVNLSYLDPYSYITDPVNAIISSVRTGRPIQETVLETMKESLRPWISPQMLAQAISEAYQGKTESGREIWNKTDSGVEIATKSVAHVAGVLKPGTVQRIERRILPAIRNEQPIYGRKLEPGPEIARELTGMAVEQFDFRNGLAYRARAFTDMDKEAEGLFHRTVSRTQTTTPADLVASYQDADKRRFLIWQDMRKDFLAAVRQGVTVEEARKLMQARGISRVDVMAISNGKYIPMPISEQTMKRARERKRTLPISELNAYRHQAFKRSLDER